MPEFFFRRSPQSRTLPHDDGALSQPYAETTDGAVALHIDFRRFDIVFLQARFERRQIEAAVLGAESFFQRDRQPVTTGIHVAAFSVDCFRF